MGQFWVRDQKWPLGATPYSSITLDIINTSSLSIPLLFQGQSPDEEELQDMIDDADEDESGTINFSEFVGLMLKRQTSGLTKEDIKQVMICFNNCLNSRLQYSM